MVSRTKSADATYIGLEADEIVELVYRNRVTNIFSTSLQSWSVLADVEKNEKQWFSEINRDL